MNENIVLIKRKLALAVFKALKLLSPANQRNEESEDGPGMFMC
jgi:hypothetical protein